MKAASTMALVLDVVIMVQEVFVLVHLYTLVGDLILTEASSSPSTALRYSAPSGMSISIECLPATESWSRRH